MLYEHQLKDYKQASTYSEIGLNLVERIVFMKQEQQQKQIQNWKKRLVRIQNKLHNGTFS
jgi:uncharacterized protein